MGRVEACICCQEIEAVKNKNIEAVTSGECQEEPTCITQHPGFHPVCINRWVLQTAWFQYKQQCKHPYDEPEHKLFRHKAYRQLARWCWGILRKEIRVVLPSCAVLCIRNFYPSPGPEEDFAFEGFRYADHRGECLLFSGHLLAVLRSVILPIIIQIKPRRRVSLVKINARFFP